MTEIRSFTAFAGANTSYGVSFEFRTMKGQDANPP